jgi:hypothetical protein
MSGMFSFLKDIDTYDTRKVGRTDVDGLTVSTAYTSDEGYETAIIDANKVYPVQRYGSKANALKGHKNWTAKAKTLKTVNVLSGLGGLVDGKKVELVRKTA